MRSPSFDLGLPRPDERTAIADRLEPRQWQKQLIQLLRARLLRPEPGGQDVLLHAGPGAGKTLGALLAFAQLRREGRLERFLVFCHRTSIASQWQASANRLGLELAPWEPGQNPDPAPGMLLSYQSAARHRERLIQKLESALAGQTWLAIADEVHHLGFDPEEPEASAWGHAFTTLSAAARLRLGLSGTPFRADSLAFCAARRLRVLERGVPCERIVPDLCVEPRRLIVAGDVRPLEFRFQDGTVEHGRRPGDRGGSDGETSPLSAEARESWRARNLRRAIRLGDEGGIALRLLMQARHQLVRVQRQHGEAGGLVIARNIAHASAISDLLERQGDRVYRVHSQDPGAAAHLAAFRDGSADWLVSVDMCTEGFDAPRIRVVAYLTTVVTRSRFLQAITRAVRMDGERAGVEPVPRHPSYVFAPADPLLMEYARSWSLSEPYWLRRPAGTAGSGPGGRLEPLRTALQALADTAGEVIPLRGPQLPAFLDQHREPRVNRERIRGA
jgi:superfamily II DNA or RNA helicase